MDDIEIIGLFFSRSEQAISELDTKYGKVCRNLSFNIVSDWQDAEECVNDAYLGTWNAIPPQRPDPLLAFVCKIVRNLSISRHRRNTAMKRNSMYDVAMAEVEEFIASPLSVENTLEAKALVKILECFLDTLETDNRVIFMRRYWFCDSYAEIAQRTGLTEKTVSVRLTRMRKSLRHFLVKEGVVV